MRFARQAIMRVENMKRQASFVYRPDADEARTIESSRIGLVAEADTAAALGLPYDADTEAVRQGPVDMTLLLWLPEIFEATIDVKCIGNRDSLRVKARLLKDPTYYIVCRYRPATDSAPPFKFVVGSWVRIHGVEHPPTAGVLGGRDPFFELDLKHADPVEALLRTARP